MASTAERIRILRKKSELTQSEFGVIFGIAKTTVSSYERGNSVPDDDLKIKICKYFDVSADYLIGLSDDTNPSASHILHQSFAPQNEKECQLLFAYRNQPQMQPAVDKLLGISDSGTVLLYEAAKSDNFAKPQITSMSQDKWELIQNTPETDEDLL